MQYIDLTFPSPQENLACDEALVDLCESGYDHQILRLWQPAGHFVVLGYSSRMRAEVYLDSCAARRIPVLRRLSGGGAVMQGPGCLNYSLLLKIQEPGPLSNVTGANVFIMERQRQALARATGAAIGIRGFTDLTLGERKFSGNAQYRRRRSLLFHGTFLLHADMDLMEELLPVPPRQSPYRRNRSHGEFLTDLQLPASAVKDALREAWQAGESFKDVPLQRIRELAAGRYSREEWNCRF